jgi:hypothetical protein
MKGVFLYGRKSKNGKYTFINIQSLIIFLAYSKHIKRAGDNFELETTEF